jgi:hypothetical protein
MEPSERFDSIKANYTQHKRQTIHTTGKVSIYQATHASSHINTEQNIEINARYASFRFARKFANIFPRDRIFFLE